jgi:hypothetical protein
MRRDAEFEAKMAEVLCVYEATARSTQRWTV